MRYLIILVTIAKLFSATLIVDKNALCIPMPFGDPICTPGCENGDKTFNSIQDAVDDAQNGDVIKICKGEYNERVRVRNWVSLTFEGAKNVEKPTDVKWIGTNYALRFDGQHINHYLLRYKEPYYL